MTEVADLLAALGKSLGAFHRAKLAQGDQGIDSGQ